MKVFKKFENYFSISALTAIFAIIFINISIASSRKTIGDVKNSYFESIGFISQKDSLTNALGEELWSAGHENGNQSEWLINGGGGEFNSKNGNSVVSSAYAKSGKYSLKMSINTSNGGGHATRNYRWKEISNHDDLIFTQYFYFPKRIDFDRNNDWFNLIQTKGVKFAKGGAGTGPDQINLPHFVLGLEVRGGAGSGGANYLSLADLQKFWGGNKPDKIWTAPDGINLPVGKWVKIQMRIIQDRGDKGRVLVWQDNNLIIDTGLRNTLRPEVDTNMYSINAYSDQTYPAVTNIYLDELSINLPAEIVEEEKSVEVTPILDPTVKIVSPSEENYEITEGEKLSIVVEASSDPRLSVKMVEFFINNKWQGAASKSPYSLSIADLKAGKYKIRAKVWDSDETFTNSKEISISVLEKENTKPYEPEVIFQNGEEGNLSEGLHINFGSKLPTDFGSVSFISDPGNEVIVGSSSTYSNANASVEKLYQDERFSSDLKLKIAVDNGKYKVITHHNELWFGEKGPSAKAGQRVFDIYLEGELSKENVDLFKISNNEPTRIEFSNVVIEDGYLDVRLKATSNKASLSGISLIPQNNNSTNTKSDENNFELYINAGTSELAVVEGLEFEGEIGLYDYYDSPTTYSDPSSSDILLFQTERHGQKLNYNIEVPNGSYTIKTFHNELWYGKNGPKAQARKRVFDISLEGEIVKENLDLFIESDNQPLTLTFDEIVVSDGVLNLSLQASTNRATISGISIVGRSNVSNSNLRLISMEEKTVEDTEEPIGTSESNKVRLYPNPAKDQIYIGGNIEEFLKFYIHDSFGNLVQQIDPVELVKVNNSFRFPLSDIKTGVYFMSVIGPDNAIERLRFIIGS